MLGTPLIIMNRLKGSENYQSWANSITLWFTGNGCEDHLTSTETNVAKDQHPKRRNLDALLYNILQQSIEPKTLTALGTIRIVILFGLKQIIYILMTFSVSTRSSLPLIVWSNLEWVILFYWAFGSA